MKDSAPSSRRGAALLSLLFLLLSISWASSDASASATVATAEAPPQPLAEAKLIETSSGEEENQNSPPESGLEPPAGTETREEAQEKKKQQQQQEQPQEEEEQQEQQQRSARAEASPETVPLPTARGGSVRSKTAFGRARKLKSMAAFVLLVVGYAIVAYFTAIQVDCQFRGKCPFTRFPFTSFPLNRIPSIRRIHMANAILRQRREQRNRSQQLNAARPTAQAELSGGPQTASG